ncbi:MAG: electron transfer flavoprotein subunit beta/FixA family protein, partial [Actinobacteria bacterium]|nr:electron transfer flavoprotein subunit beta/FixA family protein [Actinomycetota bacterium]
YTLDPEHHYVVRPNDQVLDDTDRYGVEMALQIAEANEAEVTLVSMGPAGSLQGIRQALAMGADKAIVVDDEALRGSAALVTAKVLAAAIAKEGVDLVITGTESTDGYTGVVPQQVAALLGLPCLTFARKVELIEGTLRVERLSATGYDVVECPLPALVAVTSGAVEPRYPTFKGIMAAKSKPIERPSAADLGLDPGAIGPGGSHQVIRSVRAAPGREGGRLVVDEGEAYKDIVELLEQVKVI